MTFTCLTLALTLLFEGAGGAAGAPALPTATATATATTGAGGAPAPAAADSNGPDGVPAEAGPPESEMDATERPQAPTPLPAVRTGHLQGRGMAKGSRDVISGASVGAVLVDLGPTDEQGYLIGEVPCGPRRLAVQSPGFDEAAATVDACAPMPEPLVLRLVPASDANAYRTLVRTRPPQPAIHISEQELVKTPGSLGDPLRVIESLPGVSSVAWPAPVYAVRGSNPGNAGVDHSQAPIADTYPIIVNARNVAPRLSYTHTFGPADVAVGFDGEIGRYEPTYIGPLRSDDGWDLASHRTAYLLAGYASTTVPAGSRVSVPPEVRYDHYE